MKKYFGLVFIALLIACTKEQVTKQVMNDKIPQQLPDTLRKLNVNTKMAYIPGGEYKPFYSSDTGLVTVHPFLMDERPVTNSEFLAFVKANPQWQRSKIKQIYADSSYNLVVGYCLCGRCIARCTGMQCFVVCSQCFRTKCKQTPAYT